MKAMITIGLLCLALAACGSVPASNPQTETTAAALCSFSPPAGTYSNSVFLDSNSCGAVSPSLGQFMPSSVTFSVAGDTSAHLTTNVRLLATDMLTGYGDPVPSSWSKSSLSGCNETQHYTVIVGTASHVWTFTLIPTGTSPGTYTFNVTLQIIDSINSINCTEQNSNHLS